MWGGIISYLYRQNKGRGSTNFVTGLEHTRFSQAGEKKDNLDHLATDIYVLQRFEPVPFASAV